jgi:hypothetical protein
MATKPTISEARWATGGAAVKAPLPGGLQDLGWSESQFPPIDYTNQFWNQCYLWFQFLDELTASQVAFDNTTPALPGAPATIQASIESLLGYVKEKRSVQFNGDIDLNNSKKIYFEIFAPANIQRMNLNLRGDQFSRYHYTEMPLHSHGDNIAVAAVGDHTHTFSDSFSTNFTGLHSHTDGSLGGTTSNQAGQQIITDRNGAGIFDNEEGPSMDMEPLGGDTEIIRTAAHSHTLNITGSTANAGTHQHTGSVSGTTSAGGGHSHTVTGGVSNAGPSGSGVSVNTGASKEYFNNLQVLIDGVNRTPEILTQLGETFLGTNSPTDPIVTTGHDIDLIALDTALGGGVFLIAGKHEIEFFVNSATGGALVASLETN